MKERKFVEEVKKLNLTYLDLNLSIEIQIYYTLNDNENVMIDFEGMRKEFEDKLNQISELER